MYIDMVYYMYIGLSKSDYAQEIFGSTLIELKVLK